MKQRYSPFFHVSGLRSLALVMMLCSCGGYGTTEEEQIDYDPGAPTFPGDRVVAPYTGSNGDVQTAQATMYTGFDFHKQVIQPNCSPIGGVCHNQKEYPDMRTTATFLSMIGARCNAAPRHWSTVFDRCEQVGDKLRFANTEISQIEIGYVDLIRGDYVDHREQETTPTSDSAGLHIYLREPVVSEGSNNFNDTAMFVRTIVDNGETRELVYAEIQLRFWILGDGRHLMGEIPDYRVGATEELVEIGVGQGDHNRNGIYGASQEAPAAMINPGKPLESYLIARLMGHMQNEPVPGTRMPIANSPPTVPQMVALACFIEGLPTDGSPASLEWPIDYANCSFNGDPGNSSPNVLDVDGIGGTSWSASILPLLQANCGGCHASPGAEAGFDVLEEGVYTKLLGLSSQRPDLRLVEPQKPDESYLWMKLTGASGVTQMPPGGSLTQEQLDDINEWITNGALQN